MDCCKHSSCCDSVETQKQSLACPACAHNGSAVSSVTPRHTLNPRLRKQVDATAAYYFCASPDCAVVYYSDSGQYFTTEELINRVTCKDSSPETPLCYCFKISKQDALDELKASGHSTVLASIREQMDSKGCFCEKSNPRGTCCLEEVTAWLASQTR